MAYLLEGFSPSRVLRHFEDICAIPHASGHEAALGDHVLALAKAQGLESLRDEAGNILVRVPATAGYECAPPLLVQGHLDMVCVQESGRNWDPYTEPVRLRLDGRLLRADGTSLGADNAVGLCCMMALMDASDLPHPPLELLFTTEEEVGLVGMRRFDMTRLRARRMLNMDMGDPDCMVIGSAGSGKYRLEKRCALFGATGDGLTVTLSGLRGGHSGLLAGKGHASALWLAGRLLSSLADEWAVRLVSLKTAGTGAAIPTDVTMTLCVPSAADAVPRLAELTDALRRELPSEPSLTVTAAMTEPAYAASAEDTRALADLLVLLPYDAVHRAETHPEWVLSSALLSQADFTDGQFSGRFSLRANRDEYRDVLLQRTEALCRMTDTSLIPLDDWIPAWPEREGSPLQQLCHQVYRDCFHDSLSVEVEHGTVEASIAAKAVPDMDIVGIAPKSRGAHTTDEHLYLDTVEPFWTFLTALLKAMRE